MESMPNCGHLRFAATVTYLLTYEIYDGYLDIIDFRSGLVKNLSILVIFCSIDQTRWVKYNVLTVEG